MNAQWAGPRYKPRKGYRSLDVVMGNIGWVDGYAGAAGHLNTYEDV